jgi:ABC-type multidrug transport system fused ATPase/permease subunit
MTDESDISTANTMRERSDESRIKLWILLRANRLLVSSVLTGAVFVAFVIAVAVLYPPFPRQIQSSDMIDTMFSTMITVIVTGTTLVVTIGQLVLSQENGPLGDQRDRMANSMDFREFTEELIGAPSPADPSEFLRQIIGITAQRTTALRESIGENHDETLREEVDEFAESVTGNADTVRDQLEGARFGSFDVVFAALNFNYSWKIFQVERLANEYEQSLTEDERCLLDEIKTALSLFGPAREHIKTLYFQWALINLSQMILYAAVPALAVAGIMVAIVDAGTFPGSTLGFDHITLVVGGAFAVTLVPFMLFVSYVLRIVTIAKRTLAIEPLILRDSQR